MIHWRTLAGEKREPYIITKNFRSPLLVNRLMVFVFVIAIDTRVML